MDPKTETKPYVSTCIRGGQITVLFSIRPLFQELWAFEISKYSKIAEKIFQHLNNFSQSEITIEMM